MRLVERVDESEVVLSWLAGELASERFAAELRDALAEVGANERLLTAADLSDAGENRLRYAVLKGFRGGYLGDSLDGLAWSRVELGPDEVLAIRRIRSSSSRGASA